ncbi:cytochrome b-c1 complex subunit 9 [Pelodiscus sinensis]|uniref:cytochrome b-c1 complex subunit 9 n=1 Tax=Pelodiscus sinensis TaxID=13735 RepID=UPI003F6CBBA5
MALAAGLYGALLRRTSGFALSVVLGALLFERGFDQAADGLFARLNQGKLWKHVKHKYETEEK